MYSQCAQMHNFSKIFHIFSKIYLILVGNWKTEGIMVDLYSSSWVILGGNSLPLSSPHPPRTFIQLRRLRHSLHPSVPHTSVLTSDPSPLAHGPVSARAGASLSRKVHSLSLFRRWLLLARSDLQLSTPIPQWMLSLLNPRHHSRAQLHSAPLGGSLPLPHLPSFSHYFHLEASSPCMFPYWVDHPLVFL